MPYLIKVLQKIAHVDLHLTKKHLQEYLDKIRGGKNFNELSDKMQQIEN